jgi:glycosyltransferase involved in cell wall biosynthesis
MSVDLPVFSIIIPTRNRCDLFARALNSIVCQQTDSLFAIEICVANDGSTEEYLKRYSSIIEACSLSVKVKLLDPRPNGHGPGFARNEAVEMATGNIIAFLDDDDEWVDERHLLKAFLFLKRAATDSFIYLTHQHAFEHDGQKATGSIWTEDLLQQIDLSSGAQKITCEQLMQSQGFTHLNCLMTSKQAYSRVSGFDESLRYEEDRDIFMRLSDSVNDIILSPDFVAKHYIPNKSEQINTSTLVDQKQKLLYQVNSNQKLLCQLGSPAIIKRCKRHLSDSFKKLAELYYNDNQIQQAVFFAKQALATRPTLKWGLFCIYVTFRSLKK